MAPGPDRGTTIRMDEIRRRLERLKADYRGDGRAAFEQQIDSAAASLESRHGDRVPAVEVVKLLSKLQLTAPGPKEETHAGPDQMPEGVQVENTPAGFVLRVSCGSFGGGLAPAVFAGVFAILRFRVWGDLGRDFWANTGWSFWVPAVFLGIWAVGTLALAAAAVFGFFGKIRITKEGDRGEVFAGVGKIGRTRRLAWSAFQGVEDAEVTYSYPGKPSRTRHYVRLRGTSGNYRFGSALNERQRTFVVSFLRNRLWPDPK